MNGQQPIPVTVVTGFLGAGKTTLINRWLGQIPLGEVAIIVNELGAVGIDGELLRERARVLVEIAGGCVCCTSQAELARALDDSAELEQPPKRILIETSGAASPAGVLRVLSAEARREAFELDGVITVVDATRAAAVLEQGVALEQLGYADVVVLSRADRCEPEQLARTEQLLGSRNGAAVVVRAEHGSVAISPLTGLDELSGLLALRRANSFTWRALPAPASHEYESVSLELGREVDGDRFADFMASEVATFAGRIFRIKGIVAVAGVEARLIVQGVADQVEVDFGEPWADAPRTSRLVVVGFGLDSEALRRGFESC